MCAGVKDVISLPFRTDYRGELYVHSSGRFTYLGIPDFSDRPMPVFHEFNAQMEKIDLIEQEARFIGFPELGIRVCLKEEDRQPLWAVREYNFLAQVYRHYHKHPDIPFFETNAIIGTIELVDVRHHTDSPWAEAGKFQWVYRHPRLFDQPLAKTTGGDGIWELDVADSSGDRAP